MVLEQMEPGQNRKRASSSQIRKPKAQATLPNEDDDDIEMTHSQNDLDQDDVDKNESDLDIQPDAKRRKGPGLGSENNKFGSIERITLTNFMCHSKLEVNLGPQLNFIIGHNGSGKSAILTAITVGLGGKANFTQRGGSVKALLKTNANSGSILLKIANGGMDAYKPELYGGSILVLRKILKDGASSYKIMSHDGLPFILDTPAGKTISNKREELEKIKDHMNICIDNPLTVLTQDTARSFLANSSPAELYSFVLKGTQLYQLVIDYGIIKEQIKEMNKRWEYHSETILPEMRLKYQRLKAKFQDCQRHTELELQLKELKDMLIWARIKEDEDNFMNQIRDKIDGYSAKVVRHDNEVKELNRALALASDTVVEKDNLIQPMTQRSQAIKREQAEFNQEIRKLESEEREMNGALATQRKNIAKFDEQIEQALRKAGDGNFEQIRQGKTDQIRALNNIIDVNGQEIEVNRRELDQLELSKNDERSILTRIQGDLFTKSSECQRMQSDIGRAKQQENDRFRGYQKGMENLVEEINRMERDRAWSGSKPIGPMGLHIKLRPQCTQFGKTIESLLSTIASCFCVANHKDQSTLQKLFDKHRLNIGSYMYTTQQLGRLNEPEEHPLLFSTVYRALMIDNEIVKKTLIINSKMEKIALVRSMQDGNEYTRNGFPRSVNTVYDAEAISIGTKTGGLSAQSMRLYTGPPRFTEDATEHIQELGHALQQLQHSMDDLQRRETFQQSNLAEIDRKTRNLSNKCKILSREAVASGQDANRIQETIQDDDTIHIAPLEDAKAEAERVIQQYASQFESLQRTMKDKKSEQAESRRGAEQVFSEMREIAHEIQQLNAQQENLIQQKSEAEQLGNYDRNRLDNYQRRLITDSDATQIKVDALAVHLTDAMAICARIEIPDNLNIEGIVRKTKELTARHKEMEKEYGNANEILSCLIVAEKDYRATKRDLGDLRSFCNLLQRISEQRVKTYYDLRRYICTSARNIFTAMMKNRGYRGTLVFDHKRETMDLQVETKKALVQGGDDEDEETDARIGGDMKSLSGGEKSFSTICLLLSLWDRMAVPFRALDEFDVFMDAVNRKVSMDVMTEHARSELETQYIFITPQDMSSVKGVGTAEVRVHRMLDPERGQQTLNQYFEK